MACGLVLLNSCSKEENLNIQEELSQDSAFMLKTSNGLNTIEAFTLSNTPVADRVITKRSGLNAHGSFNGFNGGNIKFNGASNGGGMHGSAEVQITFGPFGTAHVVLETTSLISVGENEVIYGGVISQIIENTVMFPPPPPGAPAPQCDPYALGSYVYLRVLDNGQGSNAPADQYRGVLFNTCNQDANSGAGFPWFVAPDLDVAQESDKIKVND